MTWLYVSYTNIYLKLFLSLEPEIDTMSDRLTEALTFVWNGSFYVFF